MFPELPPALAEALAARGYASPTSVQTACLAPETAGRDLIVSAKTGSGKTVAFGLAAAPEILVPGRVRGKPAALVVAPTRELALQVQRELAWLYAKAGLVVVSCVGGMDPRREATDLARGCDIVVGTPGRLCDHLDRGRLDLEAVRVLILDEADEMLDLGFRDELEHILVATPAGRRTMMFSATVPPAIASLAARYQANAMRIEVAAGEAHSDIEYRAVLTVPRERDLAVVNILRLMDAPGALVFCHTREGVNHLHGNLSERGFSAVVLSGELGQAERNRALSALRDGRARVCVATDVAARGIDLPDLGLVIHADMPREAATLLHRSGRTGRAGKKGLAAVIVPLNRQRAAERLFYEARVEPRWIGPPPAEQVKERDAERLLAGIRAEVSEVNEEDRAIARTLLDGGDAEALVAALVRVRRESMPEPEDVTPWFVGPPKPRPPKPAFTAVPAASLARPLAPAVAVAPAPAVAVAAAPAVAVAPAPAVAVAPAPAVAVAPAPAVAVAPAPAVAVATAIALEGAPVPLSAREKRAAKRAAARADGTLATPLSSTAAAEASAGAAATESAPSAKRAALASTAAGPAFRPVVPTAKPGVSAAKPASPAFRPTVPAGAARSFAANPGGDGDHRSGASGSGERHLPTAKARNERPPPPVTVVGATGAGTRPLRRPNAAPPRPEGVWFTVNVGLRQRADPKWLLPMICRRGNIEKEHVGGFRVFANETRVLIRGDVAALFFERASRPDRQDPRVLIAPVGGPD